ncbi:hypothetical protein NE237_028201 [Protea cynaroides]|uniref:Uncharacterized protein n=1 Tax=Protea cynaroides TaxID=273540 RepID=A0A9Q0GTB8_9MAGN|nr:hypothetical protein NE237_028201 [Protea cynaroides]
MRRCQVAEECSAVMFTRSCRGAEECSAFRFTRSCRDANVPRSAPWLSLLGHAVVPRSASRFTRHAEVPRSRGVLRGQVYSVMPWSAPREWVDLVDVVDAFDIPSSSGWARSCRAEQADLDDVVLVGVYSTLIGLLRSVLPRFDILGETYYWTGGYHLSLKLYEALLSSVFEGWLIEVLNDADIVLWDLGQEADEILKLIKLTCSHTSKKGEEKLECAFRPSLSVDGGPNAVVLQKNLLRESGRTSSEEM